MKNRRLIILFPGKGINFERDVPAIMVCTAAEMISC
jgi:hypothetical protein